MYLHFICFREEVQNLCTEVGNVFKLFLTELQYALLNHRYPNCRYVQMFRFYKQRELKMGIIHIKKKDRTTQSSCQEPVPYLLLKRHSGYTKFLTGVSCKL